MDNLDANLTAESIRSAKRAGVRAADGYVGLNFSATTNPFKLLGGQYGLTVTATFGGGTVELDILGPDNVNYVACLAPLTAAGTAILFLPPGTYRFTIATATAVYVSLQRIPLVPGE